MMKLMRTSTPDLIGWLTHNSRVSCLERNGEWRDLKPEDPDAEQRIIERALSDLLDHARAKGMRARDDADGQQIKGDIELYDPAEDWDDDDE